MKSAGKARNNGLYRHIRTSKEIIRNPLNDYIKYNIILSFDVLWSPPRVLHAPANILSVRPVSTFFTKKPPHFSMLSLSTLYFTRCTQNAGRFS